MKRVSSWPIPPLALAVACLAGAAVAQNPGLRNSFRLANSYSGSPSELNVITPWTATGPLATQGFNDNPGTICSSQAGCSITSDYGSLSVTGDGSAHNGPGNGVFLYFDQGPQAQFNDTVTITSATLPVGTPVQLQFALAFSGSVQAIDTNPGVSYSATLSAGSLYLALNNTFGTATQNYTYYVGSQLSVSGRLGVAVYLYGLLGGGSPTNYGSFAVDLAATTSVACLTPGASLVWASGRTYADPRASVTDVGGGCGPGSPVLTSGLPVFGQPQTFTVTSSLPNELVVFAWASGNPVALPLGTCTVTEDPAGLSLLVAGVTDAAGTAVIPTVTPALPQLLGSRYTVQALVFSANGPVLGFADLSNGLLQNIGW